MWCPVLTVDRQAAQFLLIEVKPHLDLNFITDNNKSILDSKLAINSG